MMLRHFVPGNARALPGSLWRKAAERAIHKQTHPVDDRGDKGKSLLGPFVGEGKAQTFIFTTPHPSPFMSAVPSPLAKGGGRGARHSRTAKLPEIPVTPPL